MAQALVLLDEALGFAYHWTDDQAHKLGRDGLSAQKLNDAMDAGHDALKLVLRHDG